MFSTRRFLQRRFSPLMIPFLRKRIDERLQGLLHHWLLPVRLCSITSLTVQSRRSSLALQAFSFYPCFCFLVLIALLCSQTFVRFQYLFSFICPYFLLLRFSKSVYVTFDGSGLLFFNMNAVLVEFSDFVSAMLRFLLLSFNRRFH